MQSCAQLILTDSSQMRVCACKWQESGTTHTLCGLLRKKGEEDEDDDEKLTCTVGRDKKIDVMLARFAECKGDIDERPARSLK